MSRIFSTVTRYVEAVGRRKTSAWGGLDTMTCFWTGPTELAGNFFPIVEVRTGAYPFLAGTSHPELTGMFVKAVRQTDEAALITAFEVDYEGMLTVPGGAQWVSPVIIARKTSVGTLSFAFGVQTTASQFSSSGLSQTTEEKVLHGSQTITLHYTTAQVKLSYRSRFLQPNPLFQSIAQQAGLGINVFKRILSPFTGGSTYSSTSSTTNLAAEPHATPYIYDVAAFIEAEQAATTTSINYGQTGGDNTIYYSINSPPDPLQITECLDFTSDPEGCYYKNSETWQIVLIPPQMVAGVR